MENTNTASATETVVRHTTALLPFFRSDGAGTPLFSVNENIHFDVLLENAGCFMTSVEESIYRAAEEVDSPAAWGAYYMAQMASGLIEALSTALSKADSTANLAELDEPGKEPA